MQRLRIFITLLLALLWVPSTGHCLLTAAFPTVFGVCCEGDRSGQDEGKPPCKDNACAQCTTLESGVNLSALTPAVAPAPLWRENDEFAQFMQRLMAAIAEQAVDLPPFVSQWSPPPRHAKFLTVALPVRGPSFLA